MLPLKLAFAALYLAAVSRCHHDENRNGWVSGMSLHLLFLFDLLRPVERLPGVRLEGSHRVQMGSENFLLTRVHFCSFSPSFPQPGRALRFPAAFSEVLTACLDGTRSVPAAVPAACLERCSQCVWRVFAACFGESVHCVFRGIFPSCFRDLLIMLPGP